VSWAMPELSLNDGSGFAGSTLPSRGWSGQPFAFLKPVLKRTWSSCPFPPAPAVAGPGQTPAATITDDQVFDIERERF
jgi:hypothetical protein